eukprot:TRINITY_DN19627_c0_g1_i1.p1 TRINITY_DN19627_c0_g1~~TRINITY_DN19627_c0_g1_i1.p1  ORF type:complete len:115 (+),score=24.55 TRINITY_DN19627_c0_g1_i1:259-603(+)
MRKLSQGALEDEECIICTVPLTEDVDYEDGGSSSSSSDEGGSGGMTMTTPHEEPHVVIEMREGGHPTTTPSPTPTTLPPLWVTPCGHFFHKQCLVTWMEEKLTCPLCRMPLPEP